MPAFKQLSRVNFVNPQPVNIFFYFDPVKIFHSKLLFNLYLEHDQKPQNHIVQEDLYHPFPFLFLYEKKYFQESSLISRLLTLIATEIYFTSLLLPWYLHFHFSQSSV